MAIEFDLIEGFPAPVSARKRDVFGRVPILFATISPKKSASIKFAIGDRMSFPPPTGNAPPGRKSG